MDIMGEEYSTKAIICYIGIGLVFIIGIILAYGVGAYVVTKAIRMALR